MAGMWDGFGTSAVSSVINAGFNELGKWTNFLWNEKSAQNAYNRQREFYEDYQSWAAQMRQLKEAGLSPSMLLSGAAGATGGTSTPQGAGAQGPAAGQFFQLNPKLSAEIELLKSQANLNNKEAGVKDAQKDNIFADTAKKYSEIENLDQDTQNKKVQNILLTLDTTFNTIRNDIAEATTQTQIDYLHNQSDYMFHQSQYMYHLAAGQHLKNRWTEETWNVQLQKLASENQQIIADTYLKYSGIQLNNAQATSLIAHIGIDFYKAYIESENVQVQRDKLEAQIEQWEKENNIETSKVDAQKRGQTLSFISNLIGSILMAGAIAMPKAN